MTPMTPRDDDEIYYGPRWLQRLIAARFIFVAVIVVVLVVRWLAGF